jgi:ABC-type lipoprotein release transport system permease subunit
MASNGNGLGCLIMTAVVDQGFREQLLTEPVEVMTGFELTEEERRVLTSIRASSFTDFAAQLHQWLERRDPLYASL